MDGWFDDPFFDRNAHHAGDIQSPFASVERRMNDMMGSMLSGFGFDDSRRGRLEDSRPTASRARVEEVTDSADAPRVAAPRSHPIVEEPDDPAPERPQRKVSKPPTETFFYSSSTTSYSGPDGVTHAKRKTYNSETGKTELAEMRKIGDKAVAVKREIDADGRVSDEMAHRNLNSAELEEFGRNWNKRQSPSLTNSSSSKRTKAQGRRRALK
jgi:hypothetical protein